ncbi:MAG: hypothetical protein Tsb0020_25560 [Haliangiales bacterium]
MAMRDDSALLYRSGTATATHEVPYDPVDAIAPDRYEIIRELGHGAFGTVYEVHDRKRGARVALKLLEMRDPEAVVRFKREFRAVAGLSHPNLVTRYELNAANDQWLLTMELVDGVDFVTDVRRRARGELDERQSDRSDSNDSNDLSDADGEPVRGDSDSDSDDQSDGDRDASSNDNDSSDDDASGDSSNDDASGDSSDDASGASDSSHATASNSSNDDASGASASDDDADNGDRARRRRAPGGGYAHIRYITRQLASALTTLHQAGIVHCDLKPSNVLVTATGRVVVLDFGMVTEVETAAHAEPTRLGTPAYMSPEQSTGDPLTPASDWYAVGVMLYEALTGALPYDGHPMQILAAKQERSPPRPVAELCPDVPEELAELCMSLLAIDPHQRPTGLSVLRRLARSRPSSSQSSRRRTTQHQYSDDAPAQLVFGREGEIAQLHRAFERSQTGTARAVFITGRSGIGKSALVERFLRELEVAAGYSGEILVLRGACYARELVPYKGLDSLIDDFAHLTAGLSEELLTAVTPTDVRALSRVFPVLSRLHEYAPPSPLPTVHGDPNEIRRRAFNALRVLIMRLSTAVPTVLVIDDLHWMDTDTMSWLCHVLGPPSAPPLLFIGTCDEQQQALLAPMRERLQRAPVGMPTVEISDLSLAPLSRESARSAAALLLDRNPRFAGKARAEALADQLAEASEGHPFLLVQLAGYAEPSAESPELPVAPDRSLARSAGADSAASALSRTINQMLDGLSESARRLLEVVAIAGRPVPQSAAADAAGLDGHALDEISPLTAARLVRLIEDPDQAGDHWVDTYLDCIRQTVLDELSPDRLARHHRRLARALLRVGAPAEWLHAHFLGAGEQLRAAQFAQEAGDQAAAAFAFERAAERYLTAAGLGLDSWRLHEKLGDALARGGRGAEAAEAYLAALAAEPSETRVPELRRRAAEQLLRVGHLEEGLEVLRTVLAEVDLRLARTRWGALISVTFRRLWLRLRGLRFQARDAAACDPRALLELDICWSTSLLLGTVDAVHGADFHSRHLQKALALGEPRRVARALASEVIYTAAPGHRNRQRARALVARASRMAARIGDPYLSAYAQMSEGIAVVLSEYDWPRACEILERADEAFRARCAGVDWERNTTMIFIMNGLYWMGAFGEIATRHPVLLESAKKRGDRYAQSALESASVTSVLLSADQPDALYDTVATALDQGAKDSPMMAWYACMSQSDADIYRRRGRVSLARILKRWFTWVGSFVFRVQLSRITSYHVRARSALDAAAQSGGLKRRLWQALVVHDARRLAAQGPRWTHALADCLRAGVAAQRGHIERACSHLDAAQEAFDDSHCYLMAHAARYVRARLAPDDQHSARALAAARRYMTEERIQAPERMVAWLVPGVLDLDEPFAPEPDPSERAADRR